MEDDLKQHLAGMEQRLTDRIQGLTERIQALTERIQALTERIRNVEQNAEVTEQRLIERIRDVETTLLTEFHKWASPAELRQRSHAAAIRALDAEIEAISDRLKRLEDNNAA